MENLLYIVWTDRNKVEIPILDEQHRGIVSTINSFHYFIRQGRGLDALAPTLVVLRQYTAIHFSTEEALMRESGYPEVDAHIELHRELTKRTEEIARRSPLERDETQALKFLKNWWLDHINLEDNKYAPYLKKMLGL